MNIHRLKLPDSAKREVRRVLGLGWTLKRGGKHIKLCAPSGRFVTLPSTPSSNQYVEREMRRHIRHIEEAA